MDAFCSGSGLDGNINPATATFCSVDIGISIELKPSLFVAGPFVETKTSENTETDFGQLRCIWTLIPESSKVARNRLWLFEYQNQPVDSAYGPIPGMSKNDNR